jgi:hypothetical protein
MGEGTLQERETLQELSSPSILGGQQCKVPPIHVRVLSNLGMLTLNSTGIRSDFFSKGSAWV